MKTFILQWIGVFLLCFILQTSIMPSISIDGIHPDLPMVALFMLAFKTGPLTAIWVGFLLGLGQDLYSASILGQNALAKTLAGGFAGIFNERVMRIDIAIQMVLLVVAFLASDACYFMIQIVKSGGGMGGVAQHLLTFTVPRALYSVIFALVPYLKNQFFGPSFPRL